MGRELRELEQLLARRTTELEACELRFRNVIARQSDAIVIARPDGIVLFVNASAELLFQRDSKELVGTSLGFPVVAGDTTEIDILRGAGDRTVAEMRVVETEWEGASAYLLSLRDITDRKRAEEERAQRLGEQAARAVAEAAGERLSLLDEASALLVASSLSIESALPAVARLVSPRFADWCVIDVLGDNDSIRRFQAGATSDEERDVSGRVAQAYPPDVHAPCGPGRTIRTGEGETFSESGFTPLLGDEHDSTCHRIFKTLGITAALSVPLLDRSRIVGAIAFIGIHPDRVYTTDDVLLVQELAQRISLALVNARLYRQIIESDRRKDEFLAMLAHELRNPLSPILSALEVLRLRYGDSDSRANWALDVVERQAKHMARLVDDLLDVSRITRGKIELRKEPLELSSIIRRVIDTSRPTIEARQHQLTVSVPTEPIWLQADHVRIEQVLVNLLNNAAKYTDPGGYIEIRVERDVDVVTIRVRDTGQGMSQEMLQHAFELFMQGDRTLDRTQGGLGIGLTLARRLVEMHGGTLRATSDGPGRGSEFVIELPLSHEPAKRVEPAATEPGSLSRALRILVIDDNVDAAVGVAEVLRLWGYDVRLAYDGPDALRQAASWTPHIILLDIGLPKMDGYEVARELRRHRDQSRTLIIAITGYGRAEDLLLSEQAGIDIHLTKPVDLIRLRRLIAAHKVNGHGNGGGQPKQGSTSICPANGE